MGCKNTEPAESSSPELAVKLDELVETLGLQPLSEQDREFVSRSLERAIGHWAASLKDEGDFEKLNYKKVCHLLTQLADHLDEISVILEPGELGLHGHNETVAYCNLLVSVARNPLIGCTEDAQFILDDFRQSVREISHSARIAKQMVDLPKSRGGRSKMVWVGYYFYALSRIAILNSIELTISTDPISRKHSGLFLDLALAMEDLLDPQMKAPTPDALVKRLERTKKRVEVRSPHIFEMAKQSRDMDLNPPPASMR